MKLAVGTFLLALLFVRSSFGLDITTQGLFRATKEACSKVSESDLHNHNFDKLNAGYFPSQEFTEIHNFIRSESAKSAALEMNATDELTVTRHILADQGFRKALFECYPNNIKMQNFFAHSIHRSDRAGKFVGIAMMLMAFKGAGRLFSLIQGWSVTVHSYLQLAGRGLQYGMLSSLFTSDSTKEEKPLQLRVSNEELNSERQKFSEMEASIRRQIKVEAEKIKSCGECSEKKQLENNIKTLQSILTTAFEFQ